MSDEPQVRAIILEPETFDEITTQYEDQIHCYEALLEQAKRSLGTFEEYAEFHSVCLEYGLTNYVRSQLEENTVRSLKNMVLRHCLDNLLNWRSSIESLMRSVKVVVLCKLYQPLTDG